MSAKQAPTLIQWGESRQRLLVEPYSSDGGGRWVVVVHGGAWQDPAITQDSGLHLISHLDKSNLAGAASVDYRLSPEVQHPGHIDDVVRGIQEISARYKPDSIVLVGHSCGVFLSGQAYFRLPELIKNVVTVEGIYNLQLLVDEYPDYRSFVEKAFGTANWPTIDWSSVPVKAIVHSKEDELISFQQPDYASRLTNVKPYVLDHGKHDEVYEKNAGQWAHLCT